MARVVHVASEDIRVPVSLARVKRVGESVLRAEHVPNADVSITFVTNERIARLNQRHLGHRGPTDVISFGFAPVTSGGPLTGDVYIAPDVARENAATHRAPVREEVLRLVIHAMLHVAGHDHPSGEARYDSPMWRRQELLLRRERKRA